MAYVKRGCGEIGGLLEVQVQVQENEGLVLSL